MLHNNSIIKENCGFGLIAHIDGVPSHKVVRTAILGLSRMQHRGAILSDGKTGDGCGLSLQMPHKFFLSLAEDEKFHLSSNFAVGMIFFPKDEKLCKKFQNIINEEIVNETLTIAKWRNVPTDVSFLGSIALSNVPQIKQVFVNVPSGWTSKDVQRRLFITRRRIEKRIDNEDFYICSLSNLVIVYKGLCMAKDLAKFYLDLANLRMQTSICLFHQRFSTNTIPKWKLAQPFRYLAHNGEINTISGNRAWARSRSYKYTTPLIPDLQTAFPFVNEEGSDSSSLDNMVELFVNGGMDLFRVMRLLVPPAWEKNPNMDDDLRAFYDFNSMHMEPWDGPAGIVLSDGRYAACSLDRNGLRPARYVITQDNLITIASEVGIWNYAADEVLQKGRIGPGQLIVIDTKESKIYTSESIDDELKSRHPYKKWQDKNVKKLIDFENLSNSYIGDFNLNKEQLKIYYKQFIYSFEEIESVIRVLGENGYEAIGSMGDDAPLAIFSNQFRLIYDYFRQYFAQVTNPPIDSLRENHVMSLSTNIGVERSVFYETESMSQRVNFASPILLYSDIKQLMDLPQEYYKYKIIDATYNPEDEDLKTALINLCNEAKKSVEKEKVVLLILSDRKISKNRMPIPAVLFVGAVQDMLEKSKLRCDANIIVETASARDPHHFAVLIGLGATAVYPFLVYESLNSMVKSGSIDISLRQVMINYRNGINKGLYKIMSKMGISNISSYRCSRLFEILGLGEDIISLCFNNMVSRIGGLDFIILENILKDLHKKSFNNNIDISIGGLLKYKPESEYHSYNPDVVNYLQKATKSGNKDYYIKYRDFVNNRPIMSIRDMLKINFDNNKSISLEEVEDVNNLYQRFDSAAMSIGALSPEAHESLAIAMNSLGGFSNSGEGGEDPKRYGTNKISRIKQVASGRFGVTASYLVNADVIQIKIAQGAKPGEGGQLPGNKVTSYIAQLRYSSPGTTLISPPPHHDIYSIEDLAQLIFDLKQVNKKALISVKLVSSAGVGTICVGVAKAYADLITISGYDGGTGASPLTSVKYAGSPWELGLVESHQALVENNLRHKIRLQVDGGLKTGLDVIKAAILGAESFGFGTGPMISLGCKYLRICHLNNCATGIATQDDILRSKHYHGLPDQVINYFKFIAQDVREYLALLGVNKLTDLIGRVDLLKVVDNNNKKLNKITFDNILCKIINNNNHSVYCTHKNNPYDKGVLNQDILEKVISSSDNLVDLKFDINNTNRSIGATLSGFIANDTDGKYGFHNKQINIKLIGTAGQSFGVWLVDGINLTLIGDANDYVGKGMSGGSIVIYPNQGVYYKPEESTIIGNTCLYGATGGQLFASGKAGERFAVRNSGAIAVVEGIGDNGCEYMTSGVICILGEVGINFGAGMTGGISYIYDINSDIDKKINLEMVEAVKILNFPIHQEYLRGLIEKHIELTNSHIGQNIIFNWNKNIDKFLLVKPKSQDMNSLLGHKITSISELRVVTQ